MDILYVGIVLFASFWQTVSPHIPVFLLILGILFLVNAIVKKRLKSGFAAAGILLLGIGGFNLWPEGRYTPHEDTTWVTLKGTIPADAKPVCKSTYYSITDSYECTTSPPLLDLNPNGSSDARRRKYISYEEDLALGDGTYTLNVPQKARLGSCEYRLYHVRFLDHGRWVFDASTTVENGRDAIDTTEPVNLMCRDRGGYRGDRLPQMSCSSDLPNQSWSSSRIAQLWIYNPHGEDAVLTLNIDFEAPGDGTSRVIY